jgi:hypothetical protein
VLKFAVAAVIVLALWWWFFGRQRVARAPSMTADEAYALLGLAPGASADEIRGAHRRLIAQIHPDAGGSEELARRVNAARDAALAAWSKEKTS